MSMLINVLIASYYFFFKEDGPQHVFDDMDKMDAEMEMQERMRLRKLGQKVSANTGKSMMTLDEAGETSNDAAPPLKEVQA